MTVATVEPCLPIVTHQLPRLPNLLMRLSNSGIVAMLMQHVRMGQNNLARRIEPSTVQAGFFGFAIQRGTCQGNSHALALVVLDAKQLPKH